MAISALVAIADGSEEMEAIIAVDVLRRAGINVTLASINPDSTLIRASRGVAIVADTTIDQIVSDHFDLIVLPGGMPGAANLRDSKELIALLRNQMKEQRWIGAICAAPAVVLQLHGMLASEGRALKATCHPSFQSTLDPRHCRPFDSVVIDGNIVTSQGPGTAFEFALTLVDLLRGSTKRAEIAGPLVL